MTQSDLLQDDLGEFCRLVGHFDGAQPKSPHEVFQECLTEVKNMRDLLQEAADYINVATGARARPYSDAGVKGEIVFRIDAVLAGK